MNPALEYRAPSNRIRARKVAVWATLCALLCSSCGSKGPTAKPPSSSRGTSTPAGAGSTTRGTTPDASATEDASASDAGALLNWTHCVNVPAATEPGEGFFNNSVQSPADFSVTRVSLGFSPDCRTPTVVLELTGGGCPGGDDHRLTLEFDAATIARQALSLGDVDLATAHGLGQINVRYQRAASLSPSGTFGTCGGESGVITLANLPELGRGAIYAGSYQMTLNACAGSVGTPQDLQGTFNAELASSLIDLCPDFTAGP